MKAGQNTSGESLFLFVVTLTISHTLSFSLSLSLSLSLSQQIAKNTVITHNA